MWRAEPSAADFTTFVRQADQATVTTATAEYVIEWKNPSPIEPNSVVAVSITLAKRDLHPTAQTIKALQAGELHEFRFTETFFAAARAETIPAAAFRVDAELVAPLPTRSVVAPTVTVSRRLTAAELIDLELDVVARLDSVGVFLGEQFTVQRNTRRARVHIEGIVETASRKKEILAALGALSLHQSVRVDVLTVAEAMKRQTKSQAVQSTVRAVEIEKKPIHVYQDLHRYVLERRRGDTSRPAEAEPDEPAIEREVQALIVKIVNRSLQARLHARALNEVAARVARGEVQLLTRDTRENWYRMLRQHASAFQRETAALRSDLQPIFLPEFASEEPDVDIRLTGDADLAAVAAWLFELGSSHDAIIARTFSRSADELNSQPPAWGPFFRSVRAAERLAAHLERLLRTNRPN
jgi:hypothetical protein